MVDMGLVFHLIHFHELGGWNERLGSWQTYVLVGGNCLGRVLVAHTFVEEKGPKVCSESAVSLIFGQLFQAWKDLRQGVTKV